MLSKARNIKSILFGFYHLFDFVKQKLIAEKLLNFPTQLNPGCLTNSLPSLWHIQIHIHGIKTNSNRNKMNQFPWIKYCNFVNLYLHFCLDIPDMYYLCLFAALVRYPRSMKSGEGVDIWQSSIYFLDHFLKFFFQKHFVDIPTIFFSQIGFYPSIMFPKQHVGSPL